MSALVGAIEAGGTKWVCAVGTGPEDIRELVRFPTTTPGETIAIATDFLRGCEARFGVLAAVGIAAFGPLDLDPASTTYGFITATPKPGWTATDVRGRIQQALNRPVMIDTDVNGAALGEWQWGAARGLDTFVYITVGTGIGGGGMVAGRLMHGLKHPEMGHMRVPHDLARDPYPGRCPFHGDCLEGLAAGPALSDRCGRPAHDIPAEHGVWELEAHYLALMSANLTLVLSPERIILGGGVMRQRQLFPAVRAGLRELIAGYVPARELEDDIEHYIVPPALDDRAGVLGALALAQRAGG